MSVAREVAGVAPRFSAWHRWLYGGLTPTLLLGFLASAVADRLVFVPWALVAGAAYAFTLHRTFGSRRLPALAVLGLALVGFALLAARHREALALGLAALGPVEAGP